MMTMLIHAAKRSRKSIIAAMALLLPACLPLSAAAEAWEVQTATEEVPGTRDIEVGRLDKGIRVLEWYLRAAPMRRKAIVMTNLCMAYILKHEYEKAASYCDQAVERDTHSKVARNNRGVLRALQGDIKGALADFHGAGCLQGCPADLLGSAPLPRLVARRNLLRAEKQYAALQQPDGERFSQQTPD